MKYSKAAQVDDQDTVEPYRVGYDTHANQTTLTLMDPYGSAMTLRMGKDALRRLIRMLESTVDPADSSD